MDDPTELENLWPWLNQMWDQDVACLFAAPADICSAEQGAKVVNVFESDAISSKVSWAVFMGASVLKRLLSSRWGGADYRKALLYHR